MKKIELTEKQVSILKDLLNEEISFLNVEAIPEASEEDKEILNIELNELLDLKEKLYK